MRSINKKIICVFLAVLVFISNSCIDNIKTDTSYMYTLAERVYSHIISHDAAIRGVELCTTQMLRADTESSIQQLINCYQKQKKDSKISFNILCFYDYSLLELKIIKSSEVIKFDNQCQKELITNYIEKSDGKKRI